MRTIYLYVWYLDKGHAQDNAGALKKLGMVFKFQDCLLKREKKILLASLKTIILNVVPEAASEFMSSFSSLPLVDFRLCFSAIGHFFQCIYHSQNNLPSCMLPVCMLRVKIAPVGCLKRISEGIFRIRKKFHRKKQKI